MVCDVAEPPVSGKDHVARPATTRPLVSGAAPGSLTATPRVAAPALSAPNALSSAGVRPSGSPPSAAVSWASLNWSSDPVSFTSARKSVVRDANPWVDPQAHVAEHAVVAADLLQHGLELPRRGESTGGPQPQAAVRRCDRSGHPPTGRLRSVNDSDAGSAELARRVLVQRRGDRDGARPVRLRRRHRPAHRYDRRSPPATGRPAPAPAGASIAGHAASRTGAVRDDGRPWRRRVVRGEGSGGTRA